MMNDTGYSFQKQLYDAAEAVHSHNPLFYSACCEQGVADNIPHMTILPKAAVGCRKSCTATTINPSSQCASEADHKQIVLGYHPLEQQKQEQHPLRPCMHLLLKRPQAAIVSTTLLDPSRRSCTATHSHLIDRVYSGKPTITGQVPSQATDGTSKNCADAVTCP